METTAKLRIGAWCLDPVSGDMAREGATVRLDPRSLRLLLCMAARAGETVSAEDLLSEGWPGVIVTPDSVYQAIASLRRTLGDDSRQASYITTVPRQGYKLVAEVAPWDVPAAATAPPATAEAPAGSAPPPSNASRSRLVFLATACIPIAIGIVFWLHNTLANDHPAAITAHAAPSPTSIAVLPFADLTEGMKNEVFADGMTEELIGRFSKVPGLKVPAPSASFYYKHRQAEVAEVAGKLGVAYILDGSVRKSGNTLRVAARLMRADSGFIIWSETYDKPFDDLLAVQDDIATAVTKALTAAIAKGNGG
ncbi:transcriptional regulator domain-containing protein [Janthinobacterium sp. HH01]|uniref:winged helix-turn-helix domain-containing protein n=1 Tax=Janthinobacterium sp. HH01 TaxID=1198452 RepID=UPI0002AEB1C0|nr:winged helix-turn-helix domain-containing protein [Janthinobacterium sp. HH01]ELX13449.1 transcriptional regulator domain-containing protein [Janthinobacterium sp. HH01]